MKIGMNDPIPFFLILCSGIVALLSGCDHSSGIAPNQPQAESMPGFEVAEGFQIELVASEPLIVDPVDMTIDEYGRLYVVEMPGYPLDTSGSGKVKLLSDKDGDGQMDASVVFAEGLTLPTGIMRWKGGVLVVDPPSVLYFEDTDGDGKSDKKEVVLTGFALSNPQHNVNNPRLGLDNWIYLGHEPAITTTTYEKKFGDRGSDVFFPANPQADRLPVNANGRSVRFKPDSHQLELLSSKTQFGHTYTVRGHRLTVNNNNHIMQEVIATRYLERNPDLLISNATESLSDHGDAAKVYPITENPEHQLLTDIGVITSASGITAYSGGLFPAEFDSAVFVAESVNNLVHVDKLSHSGATYTASRMHPDREFLASTDAWFRPVNMYIGPDGALYVLDYYRQIIEHPEWMAEEAINMDDFANGKDKGRIYRITPKGTESGGWSNSLTLGDASNEELVNALADNNSWWRSNAQRLLVDRLADATDPKIQAALVAQVQNTASPLGRLHALWTLDGIGKLTPALIKQALQDSAPGVRENAIRLAERYLGDDPELAKRLLKLAADEDPKVRFQLLCTLGYVDTAEAAQVRQQLLFADIGDEWMQVAALSAPVAQSGDLLTAVLENYDENIPAFGSLVSRLGAMAGVGQPEEAVLDFVETATAIESRQWQAPLLLGLADGIGSRELATSTANKAQLVLVKALFEHPDLSVREGSLEVLRALPLSDNGKISSALKTARTIASNKSLPPQERVIAIDFLALASSSLDSTFLRKFITPDEANAVQLAALRAWSSGSGADVAQFILDRWHLLSSELRDESVSILMTTPERISLLLDAAQAGDILPQTVGWRRSVRLMTQKDDELRSRARALFAREVGQRAEIVNEYKPALALKGSFAEGKQVFQQNCAVCHQMGEDIGVAFGPDLASLQNRQPANLLTHILDPNLSIADSYDLWAVTLKSGKVAQGVIASETQTAITLRYAGGHEEVIARNDIEALQKLDMSAMPEGLENNINLQQMTDLLAYMRQENN